MSASGNVTPEIEKPAPVTVAELMVTELLPVEVKVMDCVVDVFTDTLPKLTLAELTFRVEAAGTNCRAKFGDAPPAVAVRVAVWAVPTAETVAEKPALVAPAAIVTVAGTETAELLLARPTAYPPAAAAALTVTVQASVPAPVIDEFAHERAVATGTPVPLNAIEDEAPPEELLARVSCPVAVPAAEGANCTVRVAD